MDDARMESAMRHISGRVFMCQRDETQSHGGHHSHSSEWRFKTKGKRQSRKLPYTMASELKSCVRKCHIGNLKVRLSLRPTQSKSSIRGHATPRDNRKESSNKGKVRASFFIGVRRTGGTKPKRSHRKNCGLR